MYKTELNLPVSQSAVRSPRKSLKNSRHNPGGKGELVNNVLYGEAMPLGPTPYHLDMIFNRKGTPFVYVPLKDGTPVTYLLKNTASLFSVKVISVGFSS